MVSFFNTHPPLTVNTFINKSWPVRVWYLGFQVLFTASQCCRKRFKHACQKHKRL